MVSNNHFLSPLRYPGSKRRLAGYVSDALELNNLRPKLYVEPFVGGANVALHLLMDDFVEQVILVDLDPLVGYFWEAVFFDTDWLVNQIESIEISIERWYAFKAHEPKTKRDYALSCLFFNRTNFSGILRKEVGPLGGREQKSQYKIDCRFPRDTLIRRIERIAEHREKIAGIWTCSWSDSIERIRKKQLSGALPSKEIFFYFDPPFFNKAGKLYRYYFVDNDHKKLRDFLLDFQDHWILSYDFADQVEALYGEAIKNNKNGASKRDVELIYSTGILPGRKPTKEVIISNLNELPSKTRFWNTASGK